MFPANGNLEPPGHEGSTIIVSFTPNEYGKMLVGKLVVQTDEMQWTYEIRGVHPEYHAPEATAKVSSRPNAQVLGALNRALEGKVKGRNILRENMKVKTKKRAPR